MAMQPFEIELNFPPGNSGVFLVPVIRSGNRAIGARIESLASNDEEPNALHASLCRGFVLQAIDGICTKHLSYDRINTLLTARSSRQR